MKISGIEFKEYVPMQRHTTIRSGGTARYFTECKTENEIMEVLNLSKEKNLSLQVISGGSNIVFRDKIYHGIVMKIALKGIKISDENEGSVVIKAGESWDDFVRLSIENSLQGIECMSGIPGSVGAVPVQNVGAYGQEVSDVIESVKAIDRTSGEILEYTNEDCGFAYRQSRFKNKDRDKYIITEVNFKLNKNRMPEVVYPELKKLIEESHEYSIVKSSREKLEFVRNKVIKLRKGKSMILDSDDPNSISCGSFFMNPVIDELEFKVLQKKYPDIPFYKSGSMHKIPAAWLIESSGFRKGYRHNKAGISENHALAIINSGGYSADVIALAGIIQEKVFDKFGISLETEPVIV